MRGLIAGWFPVCIWACLFTTVAFQSPCQVVIDTVPTSSYKRFSRADLQEVITSVEQYKAQSKIISLQPLAFGTSWNAGSWGRGLFSEHYLQRTFNIYLHGHLASDSSLRFFGSHPLIRYTGRMVRAYLHTHDLYPDTTNLKTIKEGIAFLLQQQQDDGSFPYYKYRAGVSDFSPLTSKGEGEEEYETSEALRALCETYLHLNIESQDLSSDITTDSLYWAIVRAADWLSSRYDNWSRWKKNSNIPAFSAWALAGAIKVKNDTAYVRALNRICRMLVNRQEKVGDNAGMWLTGGKEAVENGSIFHDTKIWYHSIILRGLIEAFDVIPAGEQDLRKAIVNSIKLGVNHIIRFRLRKDAPSIKSYPISESEYCNGGEAFFEMLALLAYHSHFHAEFSAEERESLVNLLKNVSANLDKEIPNFTFIQNFNSISYYSNFLDAITFKRTVLFSQDVDSLLQNDSGTRDIMVSGDFDRDNLSQELAFITYKPREGFIVDLRRWRDGQLLELWRTTIADTTHQQDSLRHGVIVGDFDQDGFENDIILATVKGESDLEFCRWQLDSIGMSSTRMRPTNTERYDFNKIQPGIVAGDFDQDGFNDDLAAFYAEAPGRERIHVWFFRAESRTFDQESWPFYADSAGYQQKRLIAGDFDHDHYRDDLAAMYHVKEEKSSRQYQTIQIWMSGPEHPLAKNQGDVWWDSREMLVPSEPQITLSDLISGDLNNDGFENEIGALGRDNSIRIWQSDGNHRFEYCPSITLPQANIINDIDHSAKLFLGDFDGDGIENDVLASNQTSLATRKFLGWDLGPGRQYPFPVIWVSEIRGDCNIYLAEPTPGTRTSKEEPHPTPDTTHTEPSPIIKEKLAMYPNPTQGKLQITNGSELPVTIEIMSLFGQVVYQTALDANDEVILDLSGQQNGIYIVRFFDRSGYHTKKLYLNKT